MRFALIVVFLSSAFVSTEAAAAHGGSAGVAVQARKGHKHRAKAKPVAKTTKRSHKAKAKSEEVAVADDAVEMDTTETPSAPKVETAAPVVHAPVAQATDDEEPPAKKKR